MSNLAQTYSVMGRHADALAMQERLLDLRRRFLPKNDPEIGEYGMCSDSFFCMSAHSLCFFYLMPRCAHEQPCSEVRFIGKVLGCAFKVRDVPGISSSRAI